LPFIYYGQGVASLYGDFVERLMSELALRGTEITNRDIGLERSEMDVKYIDERGRMLIAIDDENVKVVYSVQREREEIARGLRGALTGAGIGGLLGGILRGGDVKERVIDAASGALAGGAYEAFEGFEESKENRTEFAQELTEAVKEVEDELQSIISGQEEARAQAREEASEEREELMSELEEIYAEVVSLKEEIELMELEGADVKKGKLRVERAEKLYGESMSALEAKNEIEANAKIRAAKNMLERARDLLEL
jgi:outer membrane lipoprotein SlyB